MTGKEKCLLHNFCVQYDPCQPYSPVWQEAFWTLRLTATVFCVLSRNPEPLAVGYNRGLREFYRFYNSAPEGSSSSCLSLALFLFSSRLGSLCDRVPGLVWVLLFLFVYAGSRLPKPLCYEIYFADELSV